MTHLILRICLLLATTIAATVLVCEGTVFYIPLLLSVLIVLEIMELIIHLQKFEKTIWQFFRSIQNSDHGFIIRDFGGNRIKRRIYLEMNRVNQIVKELKIDIEVRERYYQILLEKVSTGIIIVDERGFVTLTNQASLRILGLSVLNHIEQLERINLKLYSQIKTLQPRERTVVTIQTEQYSTEVSVITQKLSIRKQNLFVIILQDIRNELDHKEIESWIKLIRVQAHEIRNSLSPISSVAEALLKQAKNKEIREGLELIAERSAHLKGFVESYRQLTHLPSLEISTFNLKELIDRVRILLSYFQNFHQVSFTIHSNQDEIPVSADRNQLTQVLLNILRNSYEALYDTAMPIIKISVQQTSNQVITDIFDNGIGIPEELSEDIFVPFFTSKENGTGIGLSLSKQIIRKHGGEITIKSKPGSGTTVRIILPTRK